MGDKRLPGVSSGAKFLQNFAEISPDPIDFRSGNHYIYSMKTEATTNGPNHKEANMTDPSTRFQDLLSISRESVEREIIDLRKEIAQTVDAIRSYSDRMVHDMPCTVIYSHFTTRDLALSTGRNIAYQGVELERLVAKLGQKKTELLDIARLQQAFVEHMWDGAPDGSTFSHPFFPEV